MERQSEELVRSAPDITNHLDECMFLHHQGQIKKKGGGRRGWLNHASFSLF